MTLTKGQSANRSSTGLVQEGGATPLLPMQDASTLAALALVPEQLPAYVNRVAGLKLCFSFGFAVHVGASEAVLAGYPTAVELNQVIPNASANTLFEVSLEFKQRLDNAIAEVSGWQGLKRLTVLAPFRPSAAPLNEEGFTESQDCFFCIKLPYFVDKAPASKPTQGFGDNFCTVPQQKLRNQLRRASRELEVDSFSARGKGASVLGAEHQAIIKEYTTSRALDAGTRYIFEHLADYASEGGVKIFNARDKSGALQGFCLGDFTPLATAFYMFAFRCKGSTPGLADLLLANLVKEAQEQGYERVNLGLGINGGIEFFKQKWGACPFLPLVECSWPLAGAAKPFWKRLLGKS